MYSRGINRGLAFTKPGLYCFGFILTVGMIAVATGINGLYVFLSTGLGGFIISGLLSERAIKSVIVQRTSAAIVDAGTNFEVNFNIENRSDWFTVYAIQTYFFITKPPLRLLSKPLPHLAAHTLGKIDPSTVQTCSVRAKSLARGIYQELLVMQQTTFPFGLLEKYKFEKIDAGLTVTAGVDQKFLDEIRPFIHKHLIKNTENDEFFSHRRYSSQDSPRFLDWKRSAGRMPKDWVVKVFRSTKLNSTVIIEAPWKIALECHEAAKYEDWLRRIRTACLAIAETGRDVGLRFGDHDSIHGYVHALRSLAEAPDFHQRANRVLPSSTQPVFETSSPLRLMIEQESVRWVS